MALSWAYQCSAAGCSVDTLFSSNQSCEFGEATESLDYSSSGIHSNIGRIYSTLLSVSLILSTRYLYNIHDTGAHGYAYPNCNHSGGNCCDEPSRASDRFVFGSALICIMVKLRVAERRFRSVPEIEKSGRRWQED